MLLNVTLTLLLLILLLLMFVMFLFVGTLVFGLACKEVASQIVSGLFFAVQRPFVEGDEIMYGHDNSIGTVQKIGLMHTVIRGKCLELLEYLFCT